jgi:hypothetical protein
MRSRLTARRAAAALAFAGLVAVVGLGTAAPGRAAAPIEDLPGECPPVMPLADVARGMTGTGLSVTQGRDPETFDVEVLGVLADAVAPGRDMIVVNLSGPVIDEAGGLWFGASGSPVYLSDGADQKLVGAIAFGLAGGGSTLAGVTPAEDMVELLDLSAGSLSAQARTAVRLPRSLALRAAARTGLSVVQVSSLTRLKTPFAMSGLNDRALRRVQQAIDRQNLPLIPYVGASASADDGGGPADLGAGDSFAAAASLGDITSAGIGTTTFICDGQAVAFGHPFDFGGATTLAARAADTITIVRDPVWGSYKLANVAENAGVVTQDRLAGIAALLGDGPSTTPVTSAVTDLDTGRTRNGESQGVLPEFTPFLSFLHLLSNIDVTIDRIGPGTADAAFQITGTRDGGAPWSFSRTNRYASSFDISWDSVFELATAAELLQGFEDEDIKITGVEVSRMDVQREFKTYRLRNVLVWKRGKYVSQPFVRARPGRIIHLRAVLAPAANVDLAIRVPLNLTRDGFIEVRGGFSSFPEIPCFFEEEECTEDTALTFDGLLQALGSQPRNDVVQARLRVGDLGRVRARHGKRVDSVVSGMRILEFQLIR